MAPPRSADRLEREMAHHRDIADRAEKVWNWESPSGRCRADRRAAFFVSHGRLGPGKSALELGCGTGVFLEKVAPSGSRIRGIDLSIDLLLKAKDRVATLPNVCLDRGNAEELPYPGATFDTVYGSSILHHLDLDAALKEALRVLKPGGWLVFAEPNALNPQVALMFNCRALKPYWAVSPDEKAFSRFRAARALRRLGYQSVSVRPFDFLHPSTPAGWIRAVRALGSFLERLPLVREFAGSFVIVAQKPGS